VLRLLNTRFIPVAVDQHIHRRLQDAEGALFAKVLKQAGRGLEGGSQGVFCFTADGALLAHANVVEADPARRLLAGALRKFDPAAEAPAVETPEGTKSPLPELPAGGVIVDVTSKVLGGYSEASSPRAQYWQNSLGRDHLWIRPDEATALASGKFPDSLARRIARFHLVDNTRGEPPMWDLDEVRSLSLSLADSKVTGKVQLQTRRGERGYLAVIAGEVEVEGGNLKRFDLVAKGQFWGYGPFTPNPPPGKFPFAVAFRLVTEDCAASRVPPQAARLGSGEYLK
jgi:hypothetical protein